MNNELYKLIKNSIKSINDYYENYDKSDYDNLTKDIKYNLLNLENKFNQNDLIIILNLLLDYRINKYDYELFKNITKKYNISIIDNFNKYELLIHKYLYLLIYFNHTNNKEIKNELINFKKEITNENILNEFNKINNYIKNYDLIKLFQSPKIIYFNDINIDNSEIMNKIIINEKIKYPLLTTQYYDYDLFITYQCFIKSAINFFINNKRFYNQFMNNNINNNLIDNLLISNIDNNINSEIINTESIKQNGGDKQEIYNLFIEMIKNIDNENLMKNYYIEFKRLLNNKLNNKYLLGIPGFKLYSFYVIQDILFLLNDQFCNDCIIEYDNREDKSYIYYCNKNYFLDDILELHQLQLLNKKYNITYLDYNNLKRINNEYYNNPEKIYINNEVQYSKILKLNFDFINNKYHYEKEINKYLNHIKNTPNNLLIACPIHDITSLYMLNNKIKLYSYNYIKLKSINKYIKNNYDINIIYPFIIEINKVNYKLHSFIIVINKNTLDDLCLHKSSVEGKPSTTNHFVYYKLDSNNNDLLRFDSEKIRININTLKYLETKYKYIVDEYKQIYYNNYIKDTLYYKVIFCYYQKI